MKDHSDEIRDLLSNNNPHWKAETTDLYIHCLLMLYSAGVDVDELEALTERRLDRFHEKISEALKNKQHKVKFRADAYGKEDIDN